VFPSRSESYDFEERLCWTGPGETRVGDMLCVLLGGKLPVVLRPVQDGQVAFVGECYVHGIMWGEAMDALEEGFYQVRDFELC